jgi:hypothetical protein
VSVDDESVGSFAIDGEDWRKQAACRRDVCLVHPQCFDQQSWNPAALKALKVCETCPVSGLDGPCAEWARREAWDGVAAGELWSHGLVRRGTHGIGGFTRGCRCSVCRRSQQRPSRLAGYVQKGDEDAA